MKFTSFETVIRKSDSKKFINVVTDEKKVFTVYGEHKDLVAQIKELTIPAALESLRIRQGQYGEYAALPDQKYTTETLAF